MSSIKKSQDGASRTTAADGAISILEDETLLHELQPSWLARRDTIIYLILTFLTVGFAAPLLAIPYFRSKNSWYIITDKRIIDVQGSLTGSSTVEMPYDDITGEVKTSQSFLEGLLDKGSITFEIERTRRQTATSGSYEGRERDSQEMDVLRETLELNGVRDYTDVSNTIRRIQTS